jgi:uncharacterized phage protein (TIGR02216 family)
MSKQLDWSGLMRAGLHGLGLRPHEFWALTPVELRMMLGRDGSGSAPLARARLEELLEAFPDDEGGTGDG